MVGHRRTPAVEHGGEADAGAEMLRIGGNGDQRLGRRAEELWAEVGDGVKG